MTYFWFILSIMFVLTELTNPGLFFFLALALGALTTLLADLYDKLYINQYAYFFISSGIMFGLLQLLVKTMQKHKNYKTYQSNTHLLVGKTIEITEIISEDIGYGKLDGEIWQVKLQNKHSAILGQRSKDPVLKSALKVGMHGLVIGIKGCHLQITLL